jgi:glycosyltransferase involved in cell wall biosynthesis
MELRLLVCAFACAADPSTNFFGGGDLMAWNLIRRLGQRHRLWVLTASQNGEAIGAALERDPLPGVQFVYVDLPGWLSFLMRQQGGIQLYAYLWQWRAYFAARRLQKQFRFDAFHHLTYENDWMASISGALLPVPYLRGPAGGAHRVPKNFRRQFPARSRAWEYARMGLQWVFRHDPFFLISQERAKVLLMANREALEALPARWRKKAQLLSVNGISSNELTSPERQPQDTRFAILSAGRLIPLKGFDLALRAFALFSRKHPAAKFVIVGNGPELNRLEKLAQELGIENHVRFEGWMPRERLLAKMRACDVFLFASLRDGGGLVVVEAMAAGKPVVCFDLGGPGLHVNPECGFKVPARDPAQGVWDMAEALDRLASDRHLCAQMGLAAFERARQVYDWDRVADRIILCYESALAQPLGGRLAVHCQS